ALIVEDGGTLVGAGTVGTTTIASGGTVAPGNSIGTLHVDGDITFQAGSIYQVEANPQGDSDMIQASGQAFLEGGSVIHIGTDRDCTAASSLFPFLDPALTYADTTVTLTLARNDLGFGEIVFPGAAALTRNQQSAAAGAESTDSGHRVYDAVVMLSDDEATI